MQGSAWIFAGPPSSARLSLLQRLAHLTTSRGAHAARNMARLLRIRAPPDGAPERAYASRDAVTIRQKTYVLLAREYSLRSNWCVSRRLEGRWVWLERCAEDPGIELFLADAVALAPGASSGRHLDHQLEDVLTDLVKRCGVPATVPSCRLQGPTGIDIHVVPHAVKQIGRGCHLDRRRRSAAEDRAAAGREHHEVATAGDLAGD